MFSDVRTNGARRAGREGAKSGCATVGSPSSVLDALSIIPSILTNRTVDAIGRRTAGRQHGPPRTRPRVRRGQNHRRRGYGRSREIRPQRHAGFFDQRRVAERSLSLPAFMEIIDRHLEEGGDLN